MGRQDQRVDRPGVRQLPEGCGGQEKMERGHTKRWGDNTKEWTGLEFANSQRDVETGKDGESWLQSRQWCPNDPHGLRESEVKSEGEVYMPMGILTKTDFNWFS